MSTRAGMAYCKTKRLRCPARNRNNFLKSTYGITWDQKLAMYAAQGGKCGNQGCARPLPICQKAHVDHCHETGQVRSLLCRDCNITLGNAREDLRRLLGLVDYVKHHQHKALDQKFAI